MTTPKTEVEMIDEAAFKKYPARNDYTSASRSGFKAGIAWRDANPIEVDDREQFEKDLQEHCDTWGVSYSRYFTEGWKKCRDYKFKLSLKDANPLPHPDTVRREINIDTQNGQHSADECDDPICSHY